MSKPTVVVIGNFDGVHRGHVELIRTAAAAEPGARLVAVTFWPHPMSVIRPDQAPLLLTSLERRKELLRQVGVDEIVVVHFTAEVASWSPAQFVDTVLRPLHPTRIVVGENFRFGFRAAGDVSTLAELGAGEFKVQALPLVTDGTQPSSSTLIRHAVADGDFGGSANSPTTSSASPASWYAVTDEGTSWASRRPMSQCRLEWRCLRMASTPAGSRGWIFLHRAGRLRSR